jgi:hypothetical protein
MYFIILSEDTSLQGFYPEHGSSRFIQDTDASLLNDKVSRPRQVQS